MRNVTPRRILLATSLLLVACTVTLPTVPQTPVAPDTPNLLTAVRPTHLTIAIEEPTPGLGPWFYSSPDRSGGQALELYHAMLTTLDAGGQPVPRLAALLPSLDDGSWQVGSDGSMTTTYRLREGARWHDGAPLTPEDFRFGFELFRADPYPLADPSLIAALDRIEIPDRSTLVVRWRQAHWRAGAIRDELIPFPQRLISLQPGERPRQHPFWTTGFVGLGPFRVEQFTPGARLELRAFTSYVLGPPRLDTVTVLTGVSPASLHEGLRTGDVDLVVSPSWGPAEAIASRAIAGRRTTGVVLPVAVAVAVFPWTDASLLVPEFQDPQLRRGLAVALNRQQTNFVTSLGLMPTPTVWIATDDPRWESARGHVADLLPYDPPRAFRELAGAGWVRTPDGRLRSADGRELAFELRSRDGSPLQWHVARYWSEVGAVLDLAEGPPGPSTTLGRPVVYLDTLPLSTPVLARALDAGPLTQLATTALRPAERADVEHQLVRLATRDLPLLTLGFIVQFIPFAAGLQGVLPRTGRDQGLWIAFNAHEWEWEGHR